MNSKLFFVIFGFFGLFVLGRVLAKVKKKKCIHNLKGRKAGTCWSPWSSFHFLTQILQKVDKFSLLAFVPNFSDTNTLQPLDFSVVESAEWILSLESRSVTDSPAVQHDKTVNKRSALPAKCWKVPPPMATVKLETIWPNSPDSPAIYQADCNEQKHYQGTFCSPLNSVSVLCHYLVSGALRDRPA